MKIIKPFFKVYEDLMNPLVTKDMLTKLEMIGRTCYKSESAITEESSCKFVRRLIERGHEAMLEHVSISVEFVVDRGVSHELVRHRMASFAQESTRYCNYSKDKFGNEITVIEPLSFNDIPEDQKKKIYIADTEYCGRESVNPIDFDMYPIHKKYSAWLRGCMYAEVLYLSQLELGATPQEARAVLPNSLKTEIWMTCNLREWRHVLKLRAAGTTGKPHPQMVEVMVPLLKYFRTYLPDVFFDIEVPND